VHTVVPVALLLEHELTGPVVRIVVEGPVGSRGTTRTPVVASDQLPSGTYAVTLCPLSPPPISTDSDEVGRQEAAMLGGVQEPAMQVSGALHAVPQAPQLFLSVSVSTHVVPHRV
jgi:hypothetical protein